ncbi:MAG TPA: hypothetical protein VJV40_01550, partial [Thermodesulfobacteriota bacterium]|nr:hypothetical protein [Thermodesulfobacteriota bacterium]
ADIFPELLPEAPTGTYQGEEDLLRVGSNRMVLPADSVNDKYTKGTTATVTIDQDGVKVPDQVKDVVKDIVKDLDTRDLDRLKRGRPITRVKGKELVRLSMAPASSPMVSGTAHLRSSARRRWNIPPPRNISDSDFLEIMRLLYEDVASDTYHMPAIANFQYNDWIQYLGTIRDYSTDQRGVDYLWALNQGSGSTKIGVPPDPQSVSDADYIEIMWMLWRGVPSDKYLSLPRPEFTLNDRERCADLALRYYQHSRRTLWENSQEPGESPSGGESEEGLLSSEEGCSKPAYPTYEIGLLTQYTQEWKLTGYSRGALVSALTLAPNEELVLEVFTWDRTKV